MKAIILPDDVVERLHRYEAGGLALDGAGMDELVTRIARANAVEINEDSTALYDETLGKIAAELIEAGVPVPGTGRVFPAAVIEQAHGARERIAELEGTKAAGEMGEALASSLGVAHRQIEEVHQALGPLARGEGSFSVVGLAQWAAERIVTDSDALESVRDTIAPSGADADDPASLRTDARIAAPELAAWAVERIGHLTEKNEAIGSRVEALRDVMRDVDGWPIEDHPLEHADTIGVLEHADCLILRGAAADRELATVMQERRTFVAELERARETERTLRSRAPAAAYGTLLAAVGAIREGVGVADLNASAWLRKHVVEAIDDAVEQASRAYEEAAGDVDDEPVVTVRHSDVEYLLANMADEAGETIRLSDATLDELETFTRVKRALHEATS
jgi:hypothetical protein